MATSIVTSFPGSEGVKWCRHLQRWTKWNDDDGIGNNVIPYPVYTAKGINYRRNYSNFTH